MKKTIQTLFALTAFGAAALVAPAQPAPKILVVDLAKLFDNHYKTLEQTAKMRADDQKAKEQFDAMTKEYNGMVEKYKELLAQADNAVLSADAKAKAKADADRYTDDLRAKQNEVQQFVQKTREEMQQRLKTFRDVLLEEISHIAVDVARRKGCTLLLDKSGLTFSGVPSVIYYDPDYDITADVMKEINKDRPASATPTPAATPDATPSTDASPNITLPGVKKP